LSAMYSLKYGTLPVARATGGIQEIIEGYDATLGTGVRFFFATKNTPDAFLGFDQVRSRKRSTTERYGRLSSSARCRVIFPGKLWRRVTRPSMRKWPIPVFQQSPRALSSTNASPPIPTRVSARKARDGIPSQCLCYSARCEDGAASVDSASESEARSGETVCLCRNERLAA